MPIFAESIFGCTSLERFNIGLTYGAGGWFPRSKFCQFIEIA